MWRGRISILAKTSTEFEAHVPALFLDIALDGIILCDTDGYMAKRLAYLERWIRKRGLYRETWRGSGLAVERIPRLGPTSHLGRCIVTGGTDRTSWT